MICKGYIYNILNETNMKDNFYVLECPTCKRKCGMRISDDLLQTYNDIGAKISCPYCSNPYPISPSYLHKGEKEEVVSRNLEVRQLD